MKTKPFVALFSAALVALVFAGMKGGDEPLALGMDSAQAHVATAPMAATPAPANLVRLDTVTVRPSAEEIAAAMAETEAEVASNDSSDFGKEFKSVLEVSLPNASLAMPYYSFGRALPRMSSN